MTGGTQRGTLAITVVGPPGWLAQLEPTPEEPHPLAHADEPDPAFGSPSAQPSSADEAAPVVADLHPARRPRFR